MQRDPRRYEVIEVSPRGSEPRWHGPFSRTAAQRMYRRLVRQYREQRPCVEYRVEWGPIASGATTGQEQAA